MKKKLIRIIGQIITYSPLAGIIYASFLNLSAVLGAPERTTVDGLVLDLLGSPLSGAVVRLSRLDGIVVRQAETSAAGTYQFVDLFAGQFRLSVTLRGFRVAEQTLNTFLLSNADPVPGKK